MQSEPTAAAVGAGTDATQTSADAQQTSATFSIHYGRHYPNGKAAVDYLTGPEGMWKEIESLAYVWNYYQKCAEPGRPYDKSALIRAADGSRMFTTRDANCNLLLDLDGNGEPDQTTGAHAFHEHNGRGMYGQQLDTPFTNFWFDDNWLARLVTDAYGHAPPAGLKDVEGIRWRVLNGSGAQEPFYAGTSFDQLALDGLRYLSRGDLPQALAKWTQIRDGSGYFPDGTARGFAYPLIDEHYHLGLFEILTTVLMGHPQTPAITRDDLLQHWVALRANLLNGQERDGSRLLGWRSSISDGGSLMNTETISVDVLALGADALEVFEAGHAPLVMDDHGYVVNAPYVSATAGQSTPGYITLGPYKTYPPGMYEVQFIMRSAAGSGRGARIEVKDTRTDQVLATDEVLQSELPGDGRWASVTLGFELTESQNTLSFQTYWYGEANMDVAVVRLRRPNASK